MNENEFADMVVEIAAEPLIEVARLVRQAAEEWRTVEQTFITALDRAERVEDVLAASVGQAEARGGRRALEALAATMDAGLKTAGFTAAPA